MLASDIRHLPIVDDKGTLIGMISIKDLVKATIKDSEKTIKVSFRRVYMSTVYLLSIFLSHEASFCSAISGPVGLCTWKRRAFWFRVNCSVFFPRRHLTITVWKALYVTPVTII